MKVLENQSVELISVGESTISGMKNIIELAGRTCYKSLDKISEGSAEKFVDRMVNNKHTAMLEHGTIYLTIPHNKKHIAEQFIFLKNPAKYSEVIISPTGYYITTNYRVIVENELEEVMEFQTHCKPEHVKRLTVRLTTNLQVLGEFTRHRTMSFAVESTRYCAYAKDKFDNELTFVRPNFGIYLQNPEVMTQWEKDMEHAEYNYLKLAKMGANAQECAQVLPKSTKCEMVVSATELDWQHFFDLRYRGNTGKPHPQMEDIAEKIYMEFEEIGINL